MRLRFSASFAKTIKAFNPTVNALNLTAWKLNFRCQTIAQQVKCSSGACKKLIRMVGLFLSEILFNIGHII